jgi:hypothetical protein
MESAKAKVGIMGREWEFLYDKSIRFVGMRGRGRRHFRDREGKRAWRSGFGGGGGGCFRTGWNGI